jgi:hypothetical protein
MPTEKSVPFVTTHTPSIIRHPADEAEKENTRDPPNLMKKKVQFQDTQGLSV